MYYTTKLQLELPETDGTHSLNEKRKQVLPDSVQYCCLSVSITIITAGVQTVLEDISIYF